MYVTLKEVTILMAYARELKVRPSLCSMLFIYLLKQILESTSVLTSGCVCPGDTLTYQCIAMGEGLTVWTGTAFNCSSANNELILFHCRFSSPEGTDGLCNNGAILARSLSVEGNNYTSQLNATVTPDIAGKIIKCVYDNGSAETILFNWKIPTTGPFPPPNGLNSARNNSSRELTFSWSPVAPDCPAIHYNILASNCGSCPTTTNHTTVTCIDLPTNVSTCTFAVQTVVCGSLTGNIGNPISIVLYAIEPTIRTPTSINLTENQGTHNSTTTETVRMHNPATNSVYTISFSSVATALVVSAVAFTIVMVIYLKKSKAKTTAALELSNRAEGTIHNEPVYENVTDPLPSVSVIDTQDNIAYGCTRHQ